jgi:hypothetical protein
LSTRFTTIYPASLFQLVGQTQPGEPPAIGGLNGRHSMTLAGANGYFC